MARLAERTRPLLAQGWIMNIQPVVATGVGHNPSHALGKAPVNLPMRDENAILYEVAIDKFYRTEDIIERIEQLAVWRFGIGNNPSQMAPGLGSRQLPKSTFDHEKQPPIRSTPRKLRHSDPSFEPAACQACTSVPPRQLARLQSAARVTLSRYNPKSHKT
jgi:hypothetical protein